MTEEGRGREGRGREGRGGWSYFFSHHILICSVLSMPTPHAYVITVVIKYRLNAPIKSKLQHPPPPGKPRAFDYLLCPGSGEFDLCLRGDGEN